MPSETDVNPEGTGIAEDDSRVGEPIRRFVGKGTIKLIMTESGGVLAIGDPSPNDLAILLGGSSAQEGNEV